MSWKYLVESFSFLLDIFVQCWKLGQSAVPENCEKWLGLVNSCIYYPHKSCEIYQVLPYSVDFKAPRELWNSLSKVVRSKCNFIWDKGPANIWNDYKDQK